MNKKRVVITGMGALTPVGNSVDEYWKNLLRVRAVQQILQNLILLYLKLNLPAKLKISIL